jgi:hypothetical protein
MREAIPALTNTPLECGAQFKKNTKTIPLLLLPMIGYCIIYVVEKALLNNRRIKSGT